MNQRGSVILHVLVTGVIVAVIAAGMLRITLMNYIATERASAGQKNRKEADALLNRALTYWNETNTVCSDNIPGLPCSPPSTIPPGTCSCTCGTTPSIVVTGGGPPPCTINIISSDPQTPL